MKKHIYITLFLVITFKLSSQTVFLPNIGTKWHYSFNNFFNGSITNHKIEYIKDSIDIANNDTIKVLSTDYKFVTHCNFVGKYTLIKHRNDSVWFYNSVSNNAWQLLFVFSALPNQSWTYQSQSAGYLNTHTVSVNSISTVTINNMSLKTLNVSCKLGPYTYTATICERIGGMGFLFNTGFYNPNIACDKDDLNRFLCYEDSTFGLKQFTTYSCDYSVGLKEVNSGNQKINLYPIPANETINLKLENANNDNYKIEIINALGKLIFEKEILITNDDATINIESFPNGVYLLNLKTANSEIISKRFIIAR